MTHRSLVNHSQVGEAVSEEEQTDCTHDHREPGTPGLSGDESLPKVENVTKPKKLTGNQHHHEGDEEQVKEAPILVGVYDSEGCPSKDNRPNDRALVPSEETDDLCHFRRGNS